MARNAISQIITKVYPFFLLSVADDIHGEYSSSVSKEDQLPVPDGLWLFVDSSHGVDSSTKHLYMALHNVPRKSATETTGNHLEFLGKPSSFAKIEQPNGELDSFPAFSWSFYVRPSSRKSALILGYDGLGTALEGLQIWQDGWGIRVRQPGRGENLTIDQTLPDSLTLEEWTFVSVNYDNLLMNGIYIHTQGATTSFTVGRGGAIPETRGGVWLGSAPNLPAGYDAFKGFLSCLQFYTVSTLREALEKLKARCDPESWTDKSNFDRTKIYVLPSTMTTSGSTEITGSGAKTDIIRSFPTTSGTASPAANDTTGSNDTTDIIGLTYTTGTTRSTTKTDTIESTGTAGSTSTTNIIGLISTTATTESTTKTGTVGSTGTTDIIGLAPTIGIISSVPTSGATGSTPTTDTADFTLQNNTPRPTSANNGWRSAPETGSIVSNPTTAGGSLWAELTKEKPPTPRWVDTCLRFTLWRENVTTEMHFYQRARVDRLLSCLQLCASSPLCYSFTVASSSNLPGVCLLSSSQDTAHLLPQSGYSHYILA